jgi:hypothetical protein
MTGAVTQLYELREPERVNLHGIETGRDHLSHTALTTFLTCQQRWYWDKERRLDTQVTAEPLALGRAFADALEKGDPDLGMRNLLEAAAAERERAAGNPWLVAPSEQEAEVAATIVWAASRAYLARYGHTERREVEMRARIRNPTAGGRYSLTHDVVGRVDGLDLDTATLIEDKLTGQVQRGSLAARLRLDRQVSIGCYLVWRTTGVEIRDVKYRVTLKPGIRLRQNETHRDFLQRIADDYKGRPDHYLIEEPVTRTRDDYLRLEQELWRWAETVREARRSGVWPRNTGACHEYGGCRYLPLCADEPGAEHQFCVRERAKEAA